jgi:hypothetical protein
MQWFRFYHEFVDDPKIAMMTDSDQLLWVKALCLASANEKNRGVIELSDEEICWKIRITVESWKHAVDKFRAKGMLEHSEQGYRIVNWDKRQFKSDSSAERVAKHRAEKKPKKTTSKNKKQATGVTETQELQPCNVTVTPPDTDQIQIRADSYSEKEEIESADNANEPPEHTEMAVLSARMQDVERPVKLSEVKWQKTYKDNKPRQWQSCPISLGVARTREGMQAAVKAVGSEDEALKLFGEALQWIAVNGDEFWKRSTHGFNSLLKPDTLHFLQFGATAREQQKQQQPVHSAAAQEDSREAVEWLYGGYGASLEDVRR